MAETEVFKLDLDTAALEQKAARVEQIIAQIKQGKGRGEDVSELERSLNKELDGMARLGQQEKKAANTTEDLVKQKEKLGSAMRVVGSSAGGMVADVGGVIELLMTGQKAAIGFGAALAGIGIASAVIVKIRQSFKELANEQERVLRNQEKLKGEFLDAQEQMAGVLEQYMALTPETERASGDMRKRLENAGFTRDVATQVAPLAVMAEMDTEEAKLMAQLMVGGVGFQGPGTVKETIAAQTSEAIEAANMQMEAKRQTETVKRRLSLAEGRPGAVQLTPEERTLEWAKGENVLKEEATVEDIKKAAEHAERIAAMRRKIEAARGKPWAEDAGGEGDEPLILQYEAVLERMEGRFDKRRGGAAIVTRLEHEREREMGRIPAAQGPEREGPPAPVTFINIGTANLAPDPGSRRGIGNTGISAAAAGRHIAPLGGG